MAQVTVEYIREQEDASGFRAHEIMTRCGNLIDLQGDKRAAENKCGSLIIWSQVQLRDGSRKSFPYDFAPIWKEELVEVDGKKVKSQKLTHLLGDMHSCPYYRPRNSSE